MIRSKNPYLAWFTCSLFFMFQYILRVSPNVMMEPLREDFHVNAEQFATLGSYYLYAYALSQIPLGFLVDRYGIRRVTLVSLMLCIVGVILSAEATSFSLLQLSRVLIGIGSGIAFTGALKVASDYFDARKRSILMGLTLSFGTVGALTAGRPLVIIMEAYGWQDTLLFVNALFVPLLLLAVFALPSNRDNRKTQSFSKAAETLRGIFGNKYILIYTALAIGLYTPLSSLADLWGTDFIVKKYGFSLLDAATANTMMYLGMAIGSLVLGWYFKIGSQLRRGVQLSGFFLLILMCVIVFGPAFGFSAVMAMLIGMGFFCGAEMLCFSGASEHTTAETSGLTMGFVNTLNMLGGAILQQTIGVGLDWQWSGGYTDTGLRAYTSGDYEMALSSLIVIIGICVLLSLMLNIRKSKAV